MNRGGIRRCVAFALCAMIVLTVTESVSATPAGLKVLVNRALRPGLRYLKLRDPATSNTIYVLRVNLAKPVKLGIGLASRKKAGFEKTSAMASRYHAVAAVNGDFDVWWSRPNRNFARQGRPGHDFAQNGIFKFTNMFDYG